MSEQEELRAEIKRLKGQLTIRNAQAKADSEMYRANLEQYESACEHNFYLALRDATDGTSDFVDKIKEHVAYKNRQLESVLKKTLMNLGAICMTDGQFFSLEQYKSWAESVRDVLKQFQKDRDASPDS